MNAHGAHLEESVFEGFDGTLPDRSTTVHPGAQHDLIVEDPFLAVAEPQRV